MSDQTSLDSEINIVKYFKPHTNYSCLSETVGDLQNIYSQPLSNVADATLTVCPCKAIEEKKVSQIT